jgi:Cof subfamily protein (haloacid dehalogenase superfamily)
MHGIKLIALDLDRTTLNAESRLSQGNRAALEQAIAQGVHVVIASGRPFSSLPEDVLAVKGIEYAITSNGSALWHIPSQTCLHSFTLPPESVETILQLTGDEYRLTYEAIIRGDAFCDAEYIRDPDRFGAVAEGIAYIKATRTLVEDIHSFLRLHRDELESIDIIVPGVELRDRVMARLRPALPDVYFTSSAPQLVELAHRDAGKHAGLRLLTERLGLTPEQCAAFGDADNDADMLRFAGLGVAVANATPGCLAAADQVTAPHHEDGVAKALQRILGDQGKKGENP